VLGTIDTALLAAMIAVELRVQVLPVGVVRSTVGRTATDRVRSGAFR
jgi:hypothetical protein